MSRSVDVTALGEVLIDFASLSVDEKGYPTLKANPGGAPCNFLSALSKFGLKTAMIAKVGEDAFGKMLVETVKSKGIDTRAIIIDSSVFTTLAFVTFDESGDRSFSFARKPGADICLSESDVDFDLIKDSKVFHFGTLSLTDEPARSATQKALSFAKENGCIITYDPNLRKPLWSDLEEAKKQILWGLGNADIVKMSDEEAEFLWGCSPAEAAEIILSEYGAKLAFITLGAEGCYFANAKARGHVPGIKVNCIDTTGAGDIFGGSALSQILRLNKAADELDEEELREIVTFAVTSASLSTEKMGGIESVPDELTVREIISKNK